MAHVELPAYLSDYLSKGDIPVIMLSVWGQRLVLKKMFLKAKRLFSLLIFWIQQN